MDAAWDAGSIIGLAPSDTSTNNVRTRPCTTVHADPANSSSIMTTCPAPTDSGWVGHRNALTLESHTVRVNESAIRVLDCTLVSGRVVKYEPFSILESISVSQYIRKTILEIPVVINNLRGFLPDTSLTVPKRNVIYSRTSS